MACPERSTGFVMAGAIVTGYVGWRCQLVPVVAALQYGPPVVMAVVAASVASRGSNDAPTDVLVLIGLTTLTTGALMWMFGRFRLGNLVRYIPNTVVAAFIAGTGYLLVKGGLEVMVGFGIGLDQVGDLFELDLLKFWLPGVLLGGGIWMVERSDRLPPVAMSATIVASLGVFYIIVVLFSSIGAIEDGGWLIGPFADTSGVEPITPTDISDADWNDLISDIPGVFSVIAVSIIALLLNLSSLELVHGRRINVDVELRATGIANLAMAPFGAPPGFHALGYSVLVRRMGARTRVVPVGAAAIMVAFALVGATLVGYVPRLVVGGLLVTVGFALLVEWIKDLIRAVSRVEQILSVGIVGVIAFVGILEGIAVGLAAACAVFIVRYSRIDPVRRVASGRDIKSRVDRSPKESATLAALGNRTVVYQLQGYLDPVLSHCSRTGSPRNYSI